VKEEEEWGKKNGGDGQEPNHDLRAEDCPMATSVAKKIVRLAKKGERNPARLTEGVISSFRANSIPM
jgi:hypothetical protein